MNIRSPHLCQLYNLLRLRCLITIACIMTQTTLPCCYLTTQTCFPVYKDPSPEEKSLKLVLLYLQAEYSCASRSPCLSATGVLLDLASERLHWQSCPVGLILISHCQSTSCLRSSLFLQELNKRTTLQPDSDKRAPRYKGTLLWRGSENKGCSRSVLDFWCQNRWETANSCQTVMGTVTSRSMPIDIIRACSGVRIHGIKPQDSLPNSCESCYYSITTRLSTCPSFHLSLFQFWCAGWLQIRNMV